MGKGGKSGEAGKTGKAKGKGNRSASHVKASAVEALKAAGEFQPPAVLDPAADRFCVAICDEFRDFVLVDEAIKAGLVVYAPEMRLIISSARKGFRVARRPLFPGYVFIGATDGRVPSIERLEKLKGFAGLLRRDGRAALLPRGLVNAIWAEQAGGHWDCRVPAKKRGALPFDGRNAAPLVKAGDRVEVRAGPFAGFMAQVVRADGEGRVSLLIDMFERATAVEMGLEQVRAA